jgi:hypothetical protein
VKPRPRHRPPSTALRRVTRSAGAILRGLGALLLLFTLMVVPPVALLAFVGNPVPDQIVVGGQFTDAAVVGLLAGMVWAAWAQLMLVIAVETAAAVRGAGACQMVCVRGVT